MPVQVFIDDSGGKGHSERFVLAGLVASSGQWADFSDKWSQCLSEAPTVSVFKMRDAAGGSGDFRFVADIDRDEKLRRLARIINQYVSTCFYVAIDLDAFLETWGDNPKTPKTFHDPYFIPYQTSIWIACCELWDSGLRERFEIVFDEQVRFGPKAKAWYPLFRDHIRRHYPDEYSILPVDPLFRSDDNFIPLQASDLFAWCLRYVVPPDSLHPFHWLWREMPSVGTSVYSRYYRYEDMISVLEQAKELQDQVDEAALQPHFEYIKSLPRKLRGF